MPNLFFIIVVIVKYDLLGGPLEDFLMFIDVLSVVPGFVIYMIIIIIIFLYVRNISWLECFFFKSFPIEVFEPWMVFYFSATVNT